MSRVNAIQVHHDGGPEELRCEEIEVDDPGPGEARVRHTAIGLNFTDIHHRTGRYPVGHFPHGIGMEAAGVVEAVGGGVTEVRTGDRVAYVAASPGTYAQARIVPAARLIKLPDWLDDETAAAAILKGLTAQYLLRGAYPVRSGETILIHAAAGGVGLIMCQWARHLGARVIGTVSTPEKAALARQHGCDHPIVYTQEDVVARVRELTDGAGLPVVYDSVGASTFEQSLKCLRRRGMLVSFGSASGPAPPLDLFRLNRMGSLYVTSAGLADYIRERAELLERAEDLFGVLRSGAVKVTIAKRYKLARCAARARRPRGAAQHRQRDPGSMIMTNVELNYAIDGSGPHVVLIPAVGLDLTFVEPMARELQRDFTVLRVDLRGHGKSPTEPLAQSLDDYAEDLHALLHRLDFAPAAIAGFSFGGMLAQTLALNHPEDVSALIPCACPSTLSDDKRAISAARGTDALRDGMGSIIDVTMERWFNDDFRLAGGDAAARKRLLANDIVGWATAWRAMSRIDTLPRLGEIRVPTLCIAGETDKSSGPPIVKQIADAIPGARYAVMPGAPHMLFIEQPREVAALIAAFLKRL